MVLVEFREAALNRAFDELEEAKSSMKKVKLSLCSLEDALCELYESHDEELSDKEEYSEVMPGDTYDAEVTGNDIEVNYRRRRGMRGGMRYRSGMRRGMRMRMRESDRYTY